MSETETIEHQSYELVEDLIKDWVKQASDATREGVSEGINATEAISRMQHLYLAEPWLITSKIFDALKLSGWTPPNGNIEVEYNKED